MTISFGDTTESKVDWPNLHQNITPVTHCYHTLFRESKLNKAAFCL